MHLNLPKTQAPRLPLPLKVDPPEDSLVRRLQARSDPPAQATDTILAVKVMNVWHEYDEVRKTENGWDEYDEFMTTKYGRKACRGGSLFFVKEVEREDRLRLKSMRAPNVVQLVDVFRQAATYSLVYDYFPITLLDVTAGPRMPLTGAEAALISHDLLSGLIAIRDCLQEGHGAVRLSSCFITQGGLVKLGSIGERPSGSDADASKADVDGVKSIVQEMLAPGKSDLKALSDAAHAFVSEHSGTVLQDLIQDPFLRDRSSRSGLVVIVEDTAAMKLS